MKINCQRLVKCLEILKTTTGNKIFEVANFVKFTIDKEACSIYLSTTDFNASTVIGINDILFSDDESSNDFLIHAIKLYHILKESTCDIVEIYYDNNNDKIVLKANGIYNFVPFSDIESFPSIGCKFNVVNTYKAEHLKKIWDIASIAVTHDVTKLQYQGINFDGNWVSTDGRRVAIFKSSNEFPTKKLKEVSGISNIIIAPNFGQILKNLEGDVVFGISEDHSNVVLTCDKLNLLCVVRTLITEFPNYQGLLNARADYFKVVLSKSALLDVMRRLAVLTDKLFKTIKFQFDLPEKVLRLIVDAQNGDKGIEAIPIENCETSDDITEKILVFNYMIDYLTDGLEKLKQDDNGHVTFDIQEGKLLFLENDEFIYFMSPVLND